MDIAIVHLSSSASSCDVERLFSRCVPLNHRGNILTFHFLRLNFVLGQKRHRLNSVTLSKLALAHGLLKAGGEEDEFTSESEAEVDGV